MRSANNPEETVQEAERTARLPYVKPMIVYEGKINIRAGSPFFNIDSVEPFDDGGPTIGPTGG